MFRKACLPDIRYKDTKREEFGQNIQKVSIKYRNKKRASSSEPLASCKKSPKAFLFYLHQIFVT